MKLRLRHRRHHRPNLRLGLVLVVVVPLVPVPGLVPVLGYIFQPAEPFVVVVPLAEGLAAHMGYLVADPLVVPHKD
jgi:hypothetical protein